MTDTKEQILDRILDNISNDYDKAEGSFFYDAISPVAIEMEKLYQKQKTILNNAFVNTSSGDYLERNCAELGINRKTATKSTGIVEITGAVGASIVKGSLVATELINFVLTENKKIGASGCETVTVECQEFGVIGNVPSGTIKFFPITLEGITAVHNSLPVSDGYDTESDESLRQRYFEKINTPATSGNSFHYKQWAKEVEGVGDAKVFSTWNGAGTVKVVICDRNKNAVDNELIDKTKEHIEKNRPIGATVTVESAIEKPIHITVSIILGSGGTMEQVKMDFETKLHQYFKDIAFKDSYISYAKIGSILYDIYGVEDYSFLKVNAGNTNIPLANIEIPVLGTVVIS